MEQLTENIVKKVALRFFRHYYKYRLRYEDQPIVAKYDLQGAGGVIADGYYTFKKEDGKTFTATFEATSRDTKEEVTYKPQQKILFWDGLAVASVFTSLFLSLNFVSRFHILDKDSIPLRLFLICLSMGFAYLIFYAVARHFRRYRYIYAIEQFKKYHADEQWIALAHDVYDNPESKQFQELKSQCVFNGFGLLVVDKNLDPKVLITPARHDIFLGKRRAVEFFAGIALRRQLEKTRYGSWWNVFRSKLPVIFHKDTSLLRHRKTFYHQMMVTGISLALMGVIFWREWQRIPFKTVDEKTFRSEIAKSKSNEVREQEEFLGDSASTPQRKEKTEVYWLKESAKADSLVAENPPPSAAEPLVTKEVLVSRSGEENLRYDCDRLLNFPGTMYVIEEGEHLSMAEAKRRLDSLAKLRIDAIAMPGVCIKKGAAGYLVYLKEMYNTVEEAKRALDKLEQSGAVEANSLKIRGISRAGK